MGEKAKREVLSISCTCKDTFILEMYNRSGDISFETNKLCSVPNYSWAWVSKNHLYDKSVSFETKYSPWIIYYPNELIGTVFCIYILYLLKFPSR